MIPPASRDVTCVSRIASRSDVLPWSTCPITQTTGGRFFISFSSSSSSFRSSAIRSTFSSISAMQLYSSAISSASSNVTSWLRVTTWPRIKRFLITVAGGTFIVSASSLIVSFSGITIVLIPSSGSSCLTTGSGLINAPLRFGSFFLRFLDCPNNSSSSISFLPRSFPYFCFALLESLLARC